MSALFIQRFASGCWFNTEIAKKCLEQRRDGVFEDFNYVFFFFLHESLIKSTHYSMPKNDRWIAANVRHSVDTERRQQFRNLVR